LAQTAGTTWKDGPRIVVVAVGIGCLLLLPMLAVAAAIRSRLLSDAAPFVAVTLVLLPGGLRDLAFRRPSGLVWAWVAVGYVATAVVVWLRVLVW
jgi:hypothetical protein